MSEVFVDSFFWQENRSLRTNNRLTFLARLKGFEPPTLGSEDRCSVH